MPDGNPLGKCINDDWPPGNTQRGAQILKTLASTGHIRHDMLMDDQHIGRLIGKGGEVYKQMRSVTGCNIWCLDTCEPPGFPAEVGSVTGDVELTRSPARNLGASPAWVRIASSLLSVCA